MERIRKRGRLRIEWLDDVKEWYNEEIIYRPIHSEKEGTRQRRMEKNS